MSGTDMTGAVYCTSVKFQIGAGQIRIKKSKKEKEEPETPPELVVKPRRQFVDFGQSAKFKASFDGSSNTTLSWSKDGTQLSEDDHIKIYELDGYHYLEVCDVTIEDNGWYTCTVENPSGSDSASADLEVFEKPQLLSRSPMPVVPEWKQPLSDVTACIGDEGFELECIAQDVVKPSVKWLHNDREVFSGFHMRTQHEGQATMLTIKKVQEKDKGEFKCVMNGANGVLQTSCVLTVTPAEKREPPVFVKELHDMEVTDGDKLELVVEVKGTPPIQVYWFHNNEEVRQDSPDFLLASLGSVHTLTLPRATLACAGEFVCEAYNDWGDTDTFCLIHVREVECPELPHFVTRPSTLSAREDDPVTFTCQVQGQPLPTVVWEKGGVEITSSHKHKTTHHNDTHELTIYNVDATDSGEYACHLYNTLGEATHLFYLHLDDKLPGPITRKEMATRDPVPQDRYFLPQEQDRQLKSINKDSQRTDIEAKNLTTVVRPTAKRYQRNSRLAEFGDRTSNISQNSLFSQKDKTKDTYKAKPIQLSSYSNLVPGNTSIAKVNQKESESNDVVSNGLRTLQMERNFRNVMSRTNVKTGSVDHSKTASSEVRAPGSQTHRNFTYHRSAQNPVTSIGLRTLNKSLSTLGKEDVTKSLSSEEQSLRSARRWQDEKRLIYSPSSSLQFEFEKKDSDMAKEYTNGEKENQSTNDSSSNMMVSKAVPEGRVFQAQALPQSQTETTYRAQITLKNSSPATHLPSKSENTQLKTVESGHSKTSSSYKNRGENSNGSSHQRSDNIPERKSSLTTSGSVFTWDKSKSATTVTTTKMKDTWSDSKASPSSVDFKESSQHNSSNLHLYNSAIDHSERKPDSHSVPVSKLKPKEKETPRLITTRVSDNVHQIHSSKSSSSSSTPPANTKDDFRSIKLRPAAKGGDVKKTFKQDSSELKNSKFMSKSTDNIFAHVKLRPVSKTGNAHRNSATLSKTTADRLRLKSRSSDFGELSNDAEDSLKSSSSLSSSQSSIVKNRRVPNDASKYSWEKDSKSSSIALKNDASEKKRDNSNDFSSQTSGLMEKIRQWKTTPDLLIKGVGASTAMKTTTAVSNAAQPAVEGGSHLDRVPDWVKQKALNKRHSLQLESSSRLTSSLKAQLEKGNEDKTNTKAVGSDSHKANEKAEGLSSIDQNSNSYTSSKSLLPKTAKQPTPATLTSGLQSTSADVKSRIGKYTAIKNKAVSSDIKSRSERFNRAKDSSSEKQVPGGVGTETKSATTDSSWINRKPIKNIEHVIRQKAVVPTDKKIEQKPDWTKTRSPREIKLGNLGVKADGANAESSRFEFGNKSAASQHEENSVPSSESKMWKSTSHIPSESEKPTDKSHSEDHQKSSSEHKPNLGQRSCSPQSIEIGVQGRNTHESESSSTLTSSSTPSSSVSCSQVSSPSTPVPSKNTTNATSTKDATKPASNYQPPTSSSSSSTVLQKNPSSLRKTNISTDKTVQRETSDTKSTNDPPSSKNISVRPSWMKSKSLRHIPIYPIQDNELSPRYEPFRGTLDDSSSTISTTSISSLASDTSNLTTDSGYGKSLGLTDSCLTSDSFDEKIQQESSNESHDSASPSTLPGSEEQKEKYVSAKTKVEEKEDSSSVNSWRYTTSEVPRKLGIKSKPSNLHESNISNNSNVTTSDPPKEMTHLKSEDKNEVSMQETKETESNVQTKEKSGEDSSVSRYSSLSRRQREKDLRESSVIHHDEKDTLSQDPPRTARSEFLRNRFAKTGELAKHSDTETSVKTVTAKPSRPTELDLFTPKEPRIKSTDVRKTVTKNDGGDDNDDSDRGFSRNSRFRRSMEIKSPFKRNSDYRSSGNLRLQNGGAWSRDERLKELIGDTSADTEDGNASSLLCAENEKSSKTSSDYTTLIPTRRRQAAALTTRKSSEETNTIGAREAAGESQPSATEGESFPSFTTPLADLSVLYGSKAVLRCCVSGKPAPEVHWLHDRNPIEASKDYDISFSKLTNTAQLTLVETFTDHIGTYTCVATNALGSVCSSCRVTIETSNKSEGLALEGPVSLPPRIVSLNPRVATLTRRSTLTLTLTFFGEPSPAVKWTQGEKEFANDERVTIVTQRGSSVLTIAEVTAMDSGKISATVTSSIGSDHTSANVCVEACPALCRVAIINGTLPCVTVHGVIFLYNVPGAPVGKPHVYDIAKESASLSWCGPASSGGSQITYYVIEAKSQKETTWDVLVPQCKELSHHIFGLEPSSTYQFRVRAANKQGLGPPSEPSDKVVTADILRGSLAELSDGTSEVFTPSVEYRRRDDLPFEPRDVTINTTEAFEDLYDIGDVVGKGKFGIVYRATDKSTGAVWAAKVVKCRGREKAAIKQEIDIMNRLHHPKLLMLWDAFENPRQMVLVMEFVGAGELFERVIGEDFVLTERDCIHFLRQICEGVSYMHSSSVLHLDLKPENILCISENSNRIKIIDFGLARVFKPGDSVKVMFGTPEFIAPEVINYDEIGYATDMWSVGVITYVLLSGLSPFLGDNDMETLSNVTIGEFDFDDEAFDEISDTAKSFISKLLLKRKEKRLLTHDCLDHEWLSTDEVDGARYKRLNTDRLRHFMVRRKWLKTGNAVLAVSRLLRSSSLGSFGLSRSESTSSAEDVSNSPKDITKRPSLNSVAEEVEKSSSSADQHENESSKSNNHVDINNTSLSKDQNDNRIKEHSSNKTSGKETSQEESDSSTVNSIDDDNNDRVNQNHGSTTPESPSSPTQTLNSSHQSNGLNACDSQNTSPRAPAFTLKMVDSQAFAGDVVRFDVKVTGEPAPEISWYFEEDLLSADDKYSFENDDVKGTESLIIRSIEDDDEGEYFCKALNSTGEELCSAELSVLDM